MSAGDEFLSEGQELIETYSRLLFEIENQQREGTPPSPDQINESFRAIHTLKSLAGLAANTPLRDFTHKLEEGLHALRLGKTELDIELLHVLFESVTACERLLHGQAYDTAELLTKLEARLSAKPASDPTTLDWLDPGILGVLSEFEEHRVRENIRRGRGLFQVDVELDLMDTADGLEAIRAKLKEHGEVISFLPSTEGGMDPSRMGFAILVGSTATSDVLTAAVVDHDGRVSFLGGTDPESAKPKPAPLATDGPSTTSSDATSDATSVPTEDEIVDTSVALASSQTVRIDLGRLDALMNLVGELGLVHANLGNYAERMRQTQRIENLRDYQNQLLTMTRHLRQLQEGILDVRMVPIRQTFERVKRLLRRTSEKLGKEIEFKITGADTEIDKQIGEKLSRPLIHIVNNAISHGIEMPDERVAAGKPRAGRITLAAHQQGNRVVIELSDDGKGIDWRVIRDKAVQKGFISRDEAAELDAARAINLIFMAGFSSRDVATETAGRGVGMDVVKNEIASLSGLIDVATEPGKGSVFRVTLPSTLAIIQALVVQSADQTFCIQLNSVLESLMIRYTDIQTIEGHEVISTRGRTLPLLHLSRVFELEGRTSRSRARRANERLYIVVIGLAEDRVGLVVDELLGQQDVVIKPIGKALSQIPGLAGATELGDNRTVLLLDVATLVSEAIGGIEAVLSGAGTGANEGIRVSTKL